MDMDEPPKLNNPLLLSLSVSSEFPWDIEQDKTAKKVCGVTELDAAIAVEKRGTGSRKCVK